MKRLSSATGTPAGWCGQQKDAPVEAVADGDVERFAKDAVPLLRVRDDLGVATRDVENDRGRRRRNESAHFDVCQVARREESAPPRILSERGWNGLTADAVIDSDEGLVVHEGERACDERDCLQRSTHSRSCCRARR